MKKACACAWAMAGPLGLLFADVVPGADENASAGTEAKDLTAVIALQGLPCGQVVSVSNTGQDEYVASCQDGNRYRVVLTAEGRVVVTKIDLSN